MKAVGVCVDAPVSVHVQGVFGEGSWPKQRGSTDGG